MPLQNRFIWLAEQPGADIRRSTDRDRIVPEFVLPVCLVTASIAEAVTSTALVTARSVGRSQVQDGGSDVTDIPVDFPQQ